MPLYLTVPWMHIYDAECTQWYTALNQETQPSLQSTIYFSNGQSWSDYSFPCPPHDTSSMNECLHTTRSFDFDTVLHPETEYDLRSLWPPSDASMFADTEAHCLMFPLYAYHSIEDTSTSIHDSPTIYLYKEQKETGPQWIQGCCTPLCMVSLPRKRTKVTEKRTHRYINQILHGHTRYHVHQSRVFLNALPAPWANQLVYIPLTSNSDASADSGNQQFIVVYMDIHPYTQAMDDPQQTLWIQPFLTDASSIHAIYLNAFISSKDKQYIANCLVFHILLLHGLHGGQPSTNQCRNNNNNNNNNYGNHDRLRRLIVQWVRWVKVGIKRAVHNSSDPHICIWCPSLFSTDLQSVSLEETNNANTVLWIHWSPLAPTHTTKEVNQAIETLCDLYFPYDNCYNSFAFAREVSLFQKQIQTIWAIPTNTTAPTETKTMDETTQSLWSLFRLFDSVFHAFLEMDACMMTTIDTSMNVDHNQKEHYSHQQKMIGQIRPLDKMYMNNTLLRLQYYQRIIPMFARHWIHQCCPLYGSVPLLSYIKQYETPHSIQSTGLPCTLFALLDSIISVLHMDIDIPDWFQAQQTWIHPLCWIYLHTHAGLKDGDRHCLKDRLYTSPWTPFFPNNSTRRKKIAPLSSYIKLTTSSSSSSSSLQSSQPPVIVWTSVVSKPVASYTRAEWNRILGYLLHLFCTQLALKYGATSTSENHREKLHMRIQDVKYWYRIFIYGQEDVSSNDNETKNVNDTSLPWGAASFLAHPLWNRWLWYIVFHIQWLLHNWIQVECSGTTAQRQDRLPPLGIQWHPTDPFQVGWVVSSRDTFLQTMTILARRRYFCNMIDPDSLCPRWCHSVTDPPIDWSMRNRMFSWALSQWALWTTRWSTTSWRDQNKHWHRYVRNVCMRQLYTLLRGRLSISDQTVLQCFTHFLAKSNCSSSLPHQRRRSRKYQGDDDDDDDDDDDTDDNIHDLCHYELKAYWQHILQDASHTENAEQLIVAFHSMQYWVMVLPRNIWEYLNRSIGIVKMIRKRIQRIKEKLYEHRNTTQQNVCGLCQYLTRLDHLIEKKSLSST